MGGWVGGWVGGGVAGQASRALTSGLVVSSRFHTRRSHTAACTRAKPLFATETQEARRHEQLCQRHAGGAPGDRCEACGWQRQTGKASTGDGRCFVMANLLEASGAHRFGHRESTGVVPECTNARASTHSSPTDACVQTQAHEIDHAYWPWGEYARSASPGRHMHADAYA